MLAPSITRPLHATAQAYDRGYTFDLDSGPAGIKLYWDNRLELNSGLKAIVEMTRPSISPELYAKSLNCQPTSCNMERSCSMLRTLLHFSPDIV